MQIDKQLKRIIFACSVCVFSVPFAFSQDVEDHFNRVFLEMYFEELPKHFKVEIKSIPISSQFAEKLYKMMVESTPKSNLTPKSPKGAFTNCSLLSTPLLGG